MSFNPAKWVRAGSCEAPYIRKTFTADDFTEARINICGLGFFQLYINGNRVSDHVLVPAWTDYEDRGKRRLLYPINDKFTHRIYYLSYDITSYLVKGKNGIGVLLGNAVQTPNFGHYAAITSGFKSFLMIALWYSLGGLSLRLP